MKEIRATIDANGWKYIAKAKLQARVGYCDFGKIQCAIIQRRAGKWVYKNVLDSEDFDWLAMVKTELGRRMIEDQEQHKRLKSKAVTRIANDHGTVVDITKLAEAKRWK